MKSQKHANPYISSEYEWNLDNRIKRIEVGLVCSVIQDVHVCYMPSVGILNLESMKLVASYLILAKLMLIFWRRKGELGWEERVVQFLVVQLFIWHFSFFVFRNFTKSIWWKGWIYTKILYSVEISELQSWILFQFIGIVNKHKIQIKFGFE